MAGIVGLVVAAAGLSSSVLVHATAAAVVAVATVGVVGGYCHPLFLVHLFELNFTQYSIKSINKS